MNGWLIFQTLKYEVSIRKAVQVVVKPYGRLYVNLDESDEFGTVSVDIWFGMTWVNYN
jgi:hypothetical protein